MIIDSVCTNVLMLLNNEGAKCYIVGGYVRNAILNVQTDDLDIEVYNLEFDKLVNILQK